MKERCIESGKKMFRIQIQLQTKIDDFKLYKLESVEKSSGKSSNSNFTWTEDGKKFLLRI